MTEQLDPRAQLAAVLEKKRLHQAEIDAIDQAIAEVAPAPRSIQSVGTLIERVPVEAESVEPMKPGVRTSEMWIALALPVIVGAVVQLGWLSEQAATELGMVGGGSYIAGRSIAKAIQEWAKK